MWIVGKGVSIRRVMWATVVLACAAALIVLCIMIMSQVLDQSKSLRPDAEALIMHGWEHVMDDGRREPVYGLTRMNVGPNQPMRFEATLPDTLPRDPGLAFWSSEQSVIVHIDEKQVYVYDNSDTRAFGKGTPSAWNFVALPEDAAGKIITVTMSSPYAGGAGWVMSFYLGSMQDLKIATIQMNLPDYILCWMLFVIGLLTALLSFTSVGIDNGTNEHAVQRWFALSIMALGGYMRVDLSIPEIGFVNAYFRSVFGYVLLILMPMSFLQYLQYRFTIRWFVRAAKYVRGLFALDLLFCIGMQLTNTLDFYETVTLTHVLYILSIALAIAIYIYTIWKKDNDIEKTELIGIAALFLGALAEVTCFLLPNLVNTGRYVRLGAVLYASLMFVSFAATLLRRIQERAKMNIALEQMRTSIMLSQIQPHFLFNALCVIQDLCHGKAPKAEYATIAFSRFLRCNLDSLKAEKPIPFKQELSHTMYYLALEQIRFEKRLKVEYDIKTEAFQLPSLTLQPIVENAVRYGVMKKEEGGVVRIATSETNDSFVITVSDDGVGFNPYLPHDDGRTHIGIENVHHRLRVMCSGELCIASRPGEGTIATLILPKEA